MNVESVITLVNQIVDGSAPWYIYAVLLVIPLSIIITLREGYCWFSKSNKLISRVSRLEKHLAAITAQLEQVNNQLAKQRLSEKDSGRMEALQSASIRSNNPETSSNLEDWTDA